MLIGRYQPFHEGHQKLVQVLLDEGKNVCIALRDTPISDTDPYTIEERTKMINDVFPQVKVVSIPDIEEVVYGRKVGWGIRQLQLDKETEEISATKIREGSLVNR